MTMPEKLELGKAPTQMDFDGRPILTRYMIEEYGFAALPYGWELGPRHPYMAAYYLTPKRNL